MLAATVLFFGLIHHVVSSLNTQPLEPCHIGDVVQNECNRCLCTSKAVFQCTPVDCNKTEVLKNTKLNTNKLCFPNQMYVQKLTTCICNKDGRWPHKSCQETFVSLPPRSVEEHRCEPDSYVVIDCNVCRCGPNGDFNPYRCTKNTCEEDVARRSDMDISIKKNSVYSNCEKSNWYSFAPCQFCYCVNENKLVCNTGNYNSKKLELGTYDLQLCGKDLMREATELVPDKQTSLRESAKPNVTRAQEIPNKAKVSKDDDKVKVQDKRYSNEIKSYAGNPNEKSNENSDESHSDKEEYYSDSGESTKKFERATTIADSKANEALRESKDPKDNTDSNSEENDSKDGSAEISVDISQMTTPGAIASDTKLSRNQGNNMKEIMKEINENVDSTEDLEYNGNTLKINLPNVLNKVFEMALRKSMVSLSSDKACVPGATSTKDCNMCFCLKNGKLLCTANKCK